MERTVEVLRRDARAPLCIEPLPRWCYEKAFRGVLEKFLEPGGRLLREGVAFFASHHAYAQDVVWSVDQIICVPRAEAGRIRPGLVGLLEACRNLSRLRCFDTVEEIRQQLAERFQTEGGSLPEFCREKGAGELLLSKLTEAGLLPGSSFSEALTAHAGDVYNDCARTIQLGLWIMAASWRPQVVDAWLFESAYPFFHHTVPQHLEAPGGVIHLLEGLLSTPCR